MAKNKNKPVEAVVSPPNEVVLSDCECGEKVISPHHARCEVCKRAKGQAQMRVLFEKELGPAALMLGWP